MAHETYIRHTDGDTAVFFIHGFLGSPEHFAKYLTLVPKECAIYNILLKGHGGSVRDFAKASMKQWKEQVDSVLHELMARYENIIIAAHSMGTFFAMEAAVKYPGRIKALFLLQSPLRIGVKAGAVVNSVKSLFNLISEDDKEALAFKNSNSIDMNMRLWEYIGWLPRYVELYVESRRARETFKNVDVECHIFQSRNDELVSMKSLKYIPDKPNIKVYILENSAHFMYSGPDFLQIEKVFLGLFM